eukprot:GGOE01057648.1.p2 GENE.GGOE01057648.1~~GGOE01057648.1.p2  ORF type:complete len:106 (+),score=5.99 GGOE01057648.1:276-593(+)
MSAAQWAPPSGEQGGEEVIGLEGAAHEVVHGDEQGELGPLVGGLERLVDHLCSQRAQDLPLEQLFLHGVQRLAGAHHRSATRRLRPPLHVVIRSATPQLSRMVCV